MVRGDVISNEVDFKVGEGSCVDGWLGWGLCVVLSLGNLGVYLIKILQLQSVMFPKRMVCLW